MIRLDFDDQLRAAVKMPAALNRMLPARGGVTRNAVKYFVYAAIAWLWFCLRRFFCSLVATMIVGLPITFCFFRFG